MSYRMKSGVRCSTPHVRLAFGLAVAALSLYPGWSLAGSAPTSIATPDWLIDPSPYQARLIPADRGRQIELSNGLLRRVFRLEPNAATVGLDNLVNGQALLRGVKPEAYVEIDGTRYEIGGLKGQPNYAFLRPEWIERLKADPASFRFIGFETGPIQERIAWKQVRHHAPGVKWPPAGLHLRMDYEMPSASASAETGAPAPSATGRKLLWTDDFSKLDPAWKVHVSAAHSRSSFQNEGKVGEIYTPANTSVFAERALPPETRLVELDFDAGTDRSASWGPGIALVGAEGVIKFNVRPGGGAGDPAPQFGILAEGAEMVIGGGEFGLKLEEPLSLRLRWLGDGGMACEFQAAGGAWRTVRRLAPSGVPSGPLAVRIGKLGRQGGGNDFSEAGELIRLRMIRFALYGERVSTVASSGDRSRNVRVSVHYEMYDGVPCYSKWLTVSNGTEKSISVDRFSSEVLAVVERTSEVDDLSEGAVTPEMDVETDMAFGGMMAQGANVRAVRWLPDPDYQTQVNYARKTPCLLDVGPDLGPAELVAPGGVFESFRTWVLPFDGTDRERNGLAQRRVYRVIAPWVTENPLMMHARFANWNSVSNAIQQCAEVGFEMVILTFGSGYDVENEKPENWAYGRRLAEFARSKGLEIGTYSLLASRSVGSADDVVMAAGQTPRFGNSPCLGSRWGTNYFRLLYQFYRESGFGLLEHDGSYPGDSCLSEAHPGHRGYNDSRWAQWRTISDFYKWCRGQGIYLNVPDYYFLAGSTKSGMGYREVNWSLPREQQVIHTRQNIYDGTWEKTPSMGWMFVPLTEYQGGGAAATIEPLDQHMDHYERMLYSNLALGVQACYRGPRLYDTDRVKGMVKGWVDWFKAHRDILESDLIHGRRADARDLDWMLHVNPGLKEKGLLVVFNPLGQAIEKTLRIDLYYTGLTETALVKSEGKAGTPMKIARDYTIDLPVRVPAQGMSWFVIE